MNFPSVRLVGFFRDGLIANAPPTGIRSVPPATGTSAKFTRTVPRDSSKSTYSSSSRRATYVTESSQNRAEDVEDVPARAQWPETQADLTHATCGRRDEAVRLQDVETIRPKLGLGTTAPDRYFTLACAFRRSAQYFFIRADTAFRAAADIRLVRLVASLTD